MKNVKLAVITYNDSLPQYPRKLSRIFGILALILTETFTPKCPANVLRADPNFQLLLKYKLTLEIIISFAGLKTSGALEIIDLLCDEFSDRKEILFFVLCDHNLREKLKRLRQHGITRKQILIFEDGHMPCQEGPILEACLWKFAREMREKTLFSRCLKRIKSLCNILDKSLLRRVSFR